MEEPIEEERAGKRQRVVEQTEGGSEEDKDFVSVEAKDIWTKVLLTRVSSAKEVLGS